MNEDKYGYPIYRMNELHDMLCDLEVDKFADISKEEFQRFALKDRDVLFNRTNSFEWVGRTGIYYQNDDNERTFASYLVRFNPKESIVLPEYLCAFLNSKQGIRDIKRRARQSINQTNVNPEEVKEIEIPILDMNFQLRIKDHFEKANLCRLKSLTLYRNAENQLLEELDLKNWQPNNAPVNIKQMKESFLTSGRLDAEYYQTKYDELKKKIKSYIGGCYSLSEISKTYRGNLISDSMYVEDDTCNAYIRGADISSNHIQDDKMVFVNHKFNKTNEIQCQYNDIVFAMIGSVGTAARITKEYVGAYVSNNLGVIRITSNDIKAEYLHLLLTSRSIGKYLFEQKEMRTAQPKISDKDLQDFPIPKLPKPIQDTISAKVQESFALKAESKRLLEEAKIMVEREIEKEQLLKEQLNI